MAVATDDRPALVRQHRHGLGRVGVESPAGVVNAGDPRPASAARRELLEESGYGNGTWRPPCAASANPGTHGNPTDSFLAVGVGPVAPPVPEPAEELRVPTASIDEAAPGSSGRGTWCRPCTRPPFSRTC